MSAAAESERLPPLALLAGGLATRLRAVTGAIAKSMVQVAGEPFIAHQLRLFAREGISDVIICSGYLSEQIEEFVGDGTAFGCQVRYSRDGDRLLGTGGAIRNALPLLGARFFVTYGDSYLDTSFLPIYQAFVRSGRPGLLTVFRNDNKWDKSNIEYVDGTIRNYDKVRQTPTMKYIDYGIGAFDAAVFQDLPAAEPHDLGNLCHDLANRHLLAGFEVQQRFYEIGSPAGLAETDALLSRLRSR
jgi:NDP-sugar pyrophosphorylase family protein